VNNECLTCP